ncbi:MAG: MopE-related protein [Myxococcota bacterium]
MPRPTVVLAFLAGCNYLGADSLDRDGDGVLDPEDCDYSGPRAAEGSALLPAYRDIDGDGFGDPRDTIDVCETSALPEGYVANADDCNDTDPDIHPDAVERCWPAGIDDDCDGASEDNDPDQNFGDDASLVYPDPDEDGYPSSAVAVIACAAESSEWIAVVAGDPAPPIDCAPMDPTVNPGAIEVPYNDIDEDCDGIRVMDVDGDGEAGGPTGPDCNDGDPTIHTDALERCNGIDDDCDGLVDDDDLEDLVSTDGFYVDEDLDGWPASLVPSPGCEAAPDRIPAGATSFQQADCDDTDDDVFPGAPEVLYDLVDDDCDGVALVDLDGDGQPHAVAGGTDCDDTNPLVFVGALERCNGIDDDCDGLVDDDDPELVSTTSFFADVDRDGSPDSLVQIDGCDPGPDFLPVVGASTLVDCDPTSAAIHPGAPEVPYNGVDEDCSGADLTDVDGDGFSPPQDCQDDPTAGGPIAAAAIHPDAFEVWYDGIDQDCDGGNDHDRDRDGFSAASDPLLVGVADCDDGNPSVHPGAMEQTAGIDADCDGLAALYCWADDDDDAYGNGSFDGYGNPTGVYELLESCPQGFVSTGGDCDDGSARTHPGALEICDGEDNDCDGTGDLDAVTVFDASGQVLQHVQGTGGYGVPRVPIDASGSATEVALCPSNALTLSIDAGDISGRTVWMHGIEVGNGALEDTVIRATANATNDPGVLRIEDLRFRGLFSTDDIIRLNAVVGSTDPADRRHRLQVRNVELQSAAATRYVASTGAVLELEDVVARLGNTGNAAFDSTGGFVDATSIELYSHTGAVMELGDGTVSRLDLFDSASTGALVTIRGNGVVSALDAYGGNVGSVVRVTPGATATLGGAQLTGLTASQAPITVDGAALTLAGSTLLFTSGTTSGGIDARNGSVVTVAATRVTNATSMNDGGALRSSDSFTWITSSSFEQCSAYGNGGAVHSVGGTTAARDSLFYGNDTTGRGGAFFASNADLNLLGFNQLIVNGATGDGGAMHVQGRLTAASVLMDGNYSGGSGGGVYLDATSPASFDQLTAYGNSAGARGDAVFVDAGDLTIGTLSVSLDSASLIEMPATSTVEVDSLTGSPVVVQVINPLQSVSLQVGTPDLSLYCGPIVPGCFCDVGYGCYGAF